MRKPHMLLLQQLPVFRRDGQWCKFAHLVAQLCQLICIRSRITLHLNPTHMQFMPATVLLRHLQAQRRQAGIIIQDLPLVTGFKQGMMGMLAIDIDQEFAGIAQLLDSRWKTIHERARAPVGMDDTAQYQLVVIVGYFIARQPGLQFLQVGNVEAGDDFSFVGSGAGYAAFSPRA